MSSLDLLRAITGRWIGQNWLFLPEQAPHQSRSEAVVAAVVNGKFIEIAYTWAIDGADQAGKLLLGYQAAADLLTVVWIDSWHMGDQFMLSQGRIDQQGVVDVRGSYAVEDSPEWGWRTVIEPAAATWRMRMYNVTPEGAEFLGVEATYARSGETSHALSAP